MRLVPEINYLMFNNLADQLGFSLAFEVNLNGPEQDNHSPDCFARGSVMVGATAAGFAQELGGREAYAISLAPEVHYFRDEHFAFGLRVRYSSQSAADGYSGNALYTLAGGASLRCFLSSTGWLTPFLQFGANYNRTNELRTFYGYYRTESNYMSYDAALGTLVFLRSNLALEAGLAYTNTFSNEYGTLPRDRKVVGFTLGGRFVIER